ncbi:MAG: hypothetical protein AB7J32_00035 [Pseudonocardia sp.]
MPDDAVLDGAGDELLVEIAEEQPFEALPLWDRLALVGHVIREAHRAGVPF